MSKIFSKTSKEFKRHKTIDDFTKESLRPSKDLQRLEEALEEHKRNDKDPMLLLQHKSKARLKSKNPVLHPRSHGNKNSEHDTDDTQVIKISKNADESNGGVAYKDRLELLKQTFAENESVPEDNCPPASHCKQANTDVPPPHSSGPSKLASLKNEFQRLKEEEKKLGDDVEVSPVVSKPSVVFLDMTNVPEMKNKYDSASIPKPTLKTRKSNPGGVAASRRVDDESRAAGVAMIPESTEAITKKRKTARQRYQSPTKRHSQRTTNSDDLESLVISTISMSKPPEHNLTALPIQEKPKYNFDSGLDQWIDELNLKDPAQIKNIFFSNNISLEKLPLLVVKDLQRMGFKQNSDCAAVVRGIMTLKEESSLKFVHSDKSSFHSDTSSSRRKNHITHRKLSDERIQPILENGGGDHLPLITTQGRSTPLEVNETLNQSDDSESVLEPVPQGALVNISFEQQQHSAEIIDHHANIKTSNPKLSHSLNSNQSDSFENEDEVGEEDDKARESVRRRPLPSVREISKTRVPTANPQAFSNDPIKVQKALSSQLAHKDAINAIELYSKRRDQRLKQLESKQEREERLQKHKRMERDKLAARHLKRLQEKNLQQLNEELNLAENEEEECERGDTGSLVDSNGELHLIGARIQPSTNNSQTVFLRQNTPQSRLEALQQDLDKLEKDIDLDGSVQFDRQSSNEGCTNSSQLEDISEPVESLIEEHSSCEISGPITRESSISIIFNESPPQINLHDTNERMSSVTSMSSNKSANMLLHQLECKLKKLKEQGSEEKTIAMVQKLQNQLYSIERELQAKQRRPRTTLAPSRSEKSKSLSSTRLSIAEKELVRNMQRQQTEYKKHIRNLEQELKQLKESGSINNCELSVEHLTFDTTDKIGEGAFAEVFYGIYSGSEVAVKRLKSPLSASDNTYFRSEVSLLRELRHPNVVLLLGVCSDEDNLPLMVLEFMGNGSLFHVLHDKSRPDLDHSAYYQISKDVSLGMSYLHQHRPPVLHLDLKSMNVLLDAYGRAKIADFGFSKLRGTQTSIGSSKNSSEASQPRGSPAWMAPEILNNSHLSTKCDVYSFAVVLWEMLTREKPYNGKGLFEVLQGVVKGMRPEIPSWCPEELRRLIEDCWHNQPSFRPSFKEIIDRLDNLRLPPDWSSFLNVAGVPKTALEDASVTRSIVELVHLSIAASDTESPEPSSALTRPHSAEDNSLRMIDRQMIDIEIVSAFERLTQKRQEEASHSKLVPGLSLAGVENDSVKSSKQATNGINLNQTTKSKSFSKRLPVSGDDLQAQKKMLRPVTVGPHPCQLADLRGVGEDKLLSIAALIKKAVGERRVPISGGDDSEVLETSETLWTSDGVL